MDKFIESPNYTAEDYMEELRNNRNDDMDAYKGDAEMQSSLNEMHTTQAKKLGSIFAQKKAIFDSALANDNHQKAIFDLNEDLNSQKWLTLTCQSAM